MNNQPQKLWDPKYAAVGVVTIALAVFILDFLPGIVMGRLRKVGGSALVPDPQSLKPQAYPEPSEAKTATNPYEVPR